MKSVAPWTFRLALALASLPGPLAAEGADALSEVAAPVSLAQLAREADFIGVAQVKDTDYLRRRDIPVSGSAFLRVLITYKSGAAEDLIEVYERGLHGRECYFPNPSVLEEGRRYLLFLRRDPEDPSRYRGLPAGCAIDVLVDSENRYAVRLPVTGIRLADALGGLAQPMRFSDPYALVDDEALTVALREALLAAGQITPWAADDHASDSADPPPPSPPRQWIYTLGVPLSEFRELLQPDL